MCRVFPTRSSCRSSRTIWVEPTQAWDFDPGLVLHVMGITSDDMVGQTLALYRLLMGCLGHGVSLADEHGERLDRASEVLLCLEGGSFDAIPFEFEGSEWYELAREAVTASQRGGEGPLPRPGTSREEGLCGSGAITIPSRTTSIKS